MSTLNSTTVNGVVTQTLPATQPQHLLRLGEAMALLATLFQGPWNSLTTYVTGQMVTDGGSLYTANATTLNQRPSLTPATWRATAAAGADGTSAFIYVGYASATSGADFSLSPAGLTQVAFRVSATEIVTPVAADFAGLWVRFAGNAGANGVDGASAFLSVAYASDTSGTGFSLTPGSLNYLAVKTSTVVIASPSAGDFAGLWKRFVGADGAAGADGANGTAAYLYIAYASDTSGTGFSLTPGSGLNFIAFKTSATVISSPASGDFTGLWQRYVGAAGATGATGAAGAAGAAAYLYVAYASDPSGTGFSTTPGSGLNYIAVKASATVIASPAAGDFTGLWKNYGGNNFTATSPVVITAGVITVNAASANTASYLVQRDVSGNFAAGTATLTSAVIGSTTLSYSAGVLQVNTAVVVSALTIGTLAGVLKAAAGVVAGSADTNDLTEGTVNLAPPAGNAYFTRARVLATPITGVSSITTVAATDTILAAIGKLDAALGGTTGYAALAGDTFTGQVNVSPALATSGSPNLFVVTGAAHTTLAAATEASDVVLNLARTVQFATGTLGLQRAVQIAAPSYGFVATSTLTSAATLAISGAPIAWSNATITTAIALQIAAGAVAAGNTNAYGLYVDAPTGATNNYAAVFNTGNVGIGTAAPTNQLDLSGSYVRLRTARTPSSSSEAGNPGELFWDASYLYCRTASGTVKRSAWTTF